LRAADIKITVCGAPKYLKYCVIFTAYTQFINVAAGHGLETHAIYVREGYSNIIPSDQQWQESDTCYNNRVQITLAS
jgi:hypothetical protein